MTSVAIGLGSNVGDRLFYIQSATDMLFSFLINAKSSSIYESEPWGIVDQPKFLNSVVVGETHFSPLELFLRVKKLESALGRKERMRYGPREIDLDILAFGEEVLATPQLEIPHPRLTEREFVLGPLAEVWPKWVHPKENQPVETLWVEFSRTRPATSTVFSLPPQNTKNP